MKEKMKAIKLDVTLSAVLSIIIGILFVFWSENVTLTMAKILAIILIAVGVINLISQLMNPVGKYMGLAVSAVIILIGLWIFLKPTIVASLIPIIIGVLLVVHGVQDVALAMEAKANQAPKWWSILLIALLNILFGIYCICNAFGIAKLAIIVIGIMMIYDGLSDMFVVRKVTKSAKDIVVDSEIVHEEDMDDYM